MIPRPTSPWVPALLVVILTAAAPTMPDSALIALFPFAGYYALKFAQEVRAFIHAGKSNGNGGAATYVSGRDAGSILAKLEEVIRTQGETTEALNNVAERLADLHRDLARPGR